MRKNFKKGFIFLELMVAIGIFGIVAIACIGNYLVLLKNIKSANDRIRVLILFQQKIEELKIKNEEVKETTGNFSENYPDYTWKIELSDNVIYDSVEDIYLKPFVLFVESPGESNSTIIPFLKEFSEK
ncbi:MAG: type IV pilus modification PilV family protein [Candidatus Ratteibacteria bacterium]